MNNKRRVLRRFKRGTILLLGLCLSGWLTVSGLGLGWQLVSRVSAAALQPPTPQTASYWQDGDPTASHSLSYVSQAETSAGQQPVTAAPPPANMVGVAAPAAAPNGSRAVRRAAAGDHDLRGAPSISVATIGWVLRQYSSPAADNGQAFYDLGVQYGIDPVYMVAFFVHESTAGTAGAAVANLSVGNIRCVAGYRCSGGYAAYNNWVQSAEHWYKLITQSGLYCGAGSDRCTPETIIPRYAPSADNNNEAAYIATVNGLVASWRAAEVQQ